MSICTVSDSHDNLPLLCTVITAAKQHGAQTILPCGDRVVPNTLHQLQFHGLPVDVIHGNNSGNFDSLVKLSYALASLIHYHGQDADFTLGGKRIVLVHYPHYARAMAVTGDYDLVCYGHTHCISIETLKNIKGTQIVVCNSDTVGSIGAPATYRFGDLETMTFETLPVTVIHQSIMMKGE
jgi:putative phosphoesterase